MAAPVYDDNTMIGVIAFQFPIDRLNEIMKERDGLGKSGETYLVGDDLLMRSDSFLDPVNHSVESSFRNREQGKVDTEATANALKGNSGIKIITDYNGNPVLSAFGPVGFSGLHWSILAEIDEAEVMHDIITMRSTIIGILFLPLQLFFLSPCI